MVVVESVVPVVAVVVVAPAVGADVDARPRVRVDLVVLDRARDHLRVLVRAAAAPHVHAAQLARVDPVALDQRITVPTHLDVPQLVAADLVVDEVPPTELVHQDTDRPTVADAIPPHERVAELPHAYGRLQQQRRPRVTMAAPLECCTGTTTGRALPLLYMSLSSYTPFASLFTHTAPILW